MYVERKEGIGDGQLKSGVHRIFFSFLFIKKKNLDMPCCLWDLSSPTRDQTHAPYIGNTVLTLDHW